MMKAFSTYIMQVILQQAKKVRPVAKTGGFALLNKGRQKATYGNPAGSKDPQKRIS